MARLSLRPFFAGTDLVERRGVRARWRTKQKKIKSKKKGPEYRQHTATTTRPATIRRRPALSAFVVPFRAVCSFFCFTLWLPCRETHKAKKKTREEKTLGRASKEIKKRLKGCILFRPFLLSSSWMCASLFFFFRRLGRR